MGKVTQKQNCYNCKPDSENCYYVDKTLLIRELIDNRSTVTLFTRPRKPVTDPVETDFGTFVELKLPNKEIQRVYNTEILSRLRGTDFCGKNVEVHG